MEVMKRDSRRGIFQKGKRKASTLKIIKNANNYLK